jgi:hypothetical protein
MPGFSARGRPGRASPRKTKKAGDFPARKPGEPSVTNVTRRIEFHLLYPGRSSKSKDIGPGGSPADTQSADQPVAPDRRRCACSRQGPVRQREPEPSACADRDRRVGAASCGLGDRGARAHIGHYPRAPTGITPGEDLSHGVRAADRPASRHHHVGGLHPQRHRQPGSPSRPPVRTNSSQLPMPAAITASSIQSPPAAEAHPPRSSQPGHRSGECPPPASLTSTGRGRQPETGSCIVPPVDTAPCTSTSIQLAQSRSRPNACSPDSLCLVRHDGSWSENRTSAGRRQQPAARSVAGFGGGAVSWLW